MKNPKGNNSKDTVINLLKEGKFSKKNIDGITVLYNRASSDWMQEARVCFITKYKTEAEAKKQAELIGFYRQAVQEGTINNTSSDALERAMIEAGANQDFFGIDQVKDRISLCLPIIMPSGTTGLTAANKGLKFIDEIIKDSLAFSEKGNEIIENTRRQCIIDVKGLIRNHRHMGINAFNKKFFPGSEDLSIEEIVKIVSEAKADDLKNSFENHMANSFPIVIFSGNSKLEKCLSAILPFVKKYAGNGKEKEVLEDIEITSIKKREKLYEVYGPSEQMIFLCAYPFAQTPKEKSEIASLIIANRIFGAGWDSNLMNALRHENNLVYSADSQFYMTKNMFFVQIQHNPKYLRRVIELTDKSLEKMLKGISQIKFNNVRDEITEEILVHYSSNDLLCCNQPGFRVSAAYNDLIKSENKLTSEEMIEEIEKLSKGDIEKTARKYLDKERKQILTYSSKGEKK